MNNRTRKYIENELLTVEELARYIGIKPEAVQSRSLRKKIDSVKKGNQLLFFKGDFKQGDSGNKPVK